MRRAALSLALTIAFLLPAVPAQTTVEGVQPYSIVVDGETATGLVAYPPGDIAYRGLVVISHGYGHKAESHRGHLEHLATQGYVAVAMEFRGEGFPLATGAADTIAATQDLLAAHPTDNVYLYSVSMGTAVAGIVLADLPGVFDYWVNNEGLASLPETWTEATAVSPGIPFGAQARGDIERETGGTPAEVPAEFAKRTALVRAAEFEGLQGVVLTHGVNDGLVPYNQGREMASALRGLGIPSEFYTVIRCTPGGEGTTITGHATLGGQGVCGHGTESLDSHTMTSLSFALLDQVLAGTLVPADREHVLDNGVEVTP